VNNSGIPLADNIPPEVVPLKSRGRRISCNTACNVVSTFVGGCPMRMAAA